MYPKRVPSVFLLFNPAGRFTPHVVVPFITSVKFSSYKIKETSVVLSSLDNSVNTTCSVWSSLSNFQSILLIKDVPKSLLYAFVIKS